MKINDCFEKDSCKYNISPKTWFKRIYKLYISQRYSMSVFLRLTEYFYYKYSSSGNKLYYVFANYFKRKNEVLNQFEHGFKHNIAPKTLFHHTGVTLQSGIVINDGVQIFKNVTFALVNGKVCEIGENTIVFSHVIILGCKIGKNSIVAAGAVVTEDMPDNSVIAGVPAKVIKTCKSTSEYLEFK